MICEQQFVRYATESLGPTFLTPQACEGIHSVAGKLPDVAICHILECALWGPAGTADYSIALLRGSGGRTTLQRVVSATDCEQTASIRAVLAAADGPLSGAGIIWLEYDIAVDGSAGSPSFFAAPRVHPAPHADIAALSTALFQSLNAEAAPSVEPLLRALPEGVFLRQVGVMAGRPMPVGRTVRLVLSGISSDQIVPILAQIGWPGSLPRARRYQNLIKSMSPGAACRLDLDLRQSLMPTLGVELSSSAISDAGRMTALLTESGLGTNPKISALSRLMQRQRVGPSISDDAPSRLDFGLNHLKFGIGGDGDGPDQTKAYFSLVKTPDFEATVAAGDRPELRRKDR